MRSRSVASDPASRRSRHVMRTSHEERVYLYSVRARLGLAIVQKWDAQRRGHNGDEQAAVEEVDRIEQELDTQELCLRYHMVNENDTIPSLASDDAGLVVAHMKCFAINSIEERYEELLRRHWDAWYPNVAPPTLEATAAERAWLISSRKQFALVFAKQQYDASHKGCDEMAGITDAWLDRLREEARRHSVIARYQHVYGWWTALSIEGLARQDASVPTANCEVGADFDEENVAEVVDILTADWRPRLAWSPGV